MKKMDKIEDYTEELFLEFVRKIFDVSGTTEAEDIKNILEFNRLTQHPDGSALIYFPREGREDTPGVSSRNSRNGVWQMVNPVSNHSKDNHAFWIRTLLHALSNSG